MRGRLCSAVLSCIILLESTAGTYSTFSCHCLGLQTCFQGHPTLEKTEPECDFIPTVHCRFPCQGNVQCRCQLGAGRGPIQPCAGGTTYITAACTSVYLPRYPGHPGATVQHLWSSCGPQIHQPFTLCSWCWLVIRTLGRASARSSPFSTRSRSGLVSAPSPPGSWAAQKNTGVSKYPRPKSTHGRHSSLLQPPACLGPPKRSSSKQATAKRSAAQHSRAEPSPVVSQSKLN